MDLDTANEFRNILRRIYSLENSERYHSICAKNHNPDADRIWMLCEAFWHPDYAHRTYDIEKYEPNPYLDNATAKRYLKELNHLLDKLGWN